MKKIAYIYIFLFFAMVVSCVANAQCPPSTWSLDVTINPDQYPEETSFYILNFNGDTLLQGGPFEDIVDYQPQYISACAPVDSFILVLKDAYGDGMAGSLWGGNDGSVYVEQCGDTIWWLDSADFGFQIFDTIYTSGCPPPPPVYGCMNENFLEFLPEATVDTGMCFTPKLWGCTDSLAFNYDPLANIDILVDSCVHTLELTDLAGNGWAGSTLKLSQATSIVPPFNYQDLGTYTLLDGFDTTFFVNLAAGYPVRAVFEITQQSDFTAVQCGYSLYSEDYVAIDIEGGFVNPIPPFLPIIGDPYCGNNCIERTYGCIDSTALNYNDSVNTDDGSCYYLPGCMNPNYIEYNSQADFDDGSCLTLIVLGCMDSTALNYNPEANVELEGSCIEVVLGCMDDDAFNYNVNANVDDGSCIPLIFGCIDPTAVNYCDTCNTDNGSCIEVVNGCTDSTALNYNALANTDNGSCIYPLPGCTDATAINFDPLANIADSSCYYSAGCVSGDVYYIPNACFEWVIEVDPYCCDGLWDVSCVELYDYCQEGWTGPTDLIEVRYGLFIYPNPTSDYIYINSRLKVDLTVVDMLGNIVISKSKTNTLDVFKLTPGIYNVIINHDKIRTNKKIIKQ
jgi:hypothetical protein